MTESPRSRRRSRGPVPGAREEQSSEESASAEAPGVDALLSGMRDADETCRGRLVATRIRGLGGPLNEGVHAPRIQDGQGRSLELDDAGLFLVDALPPLCEGVAVEPRDAHGRGGVAGVRR